MEFDPITPLADALPGLVWVALPDGRAEFINKRWCEYTGLTPEQAMGTGWQGAIHPDDLTLALKFWNGLLASDKPGEVVARLRRHDGKYRRFLFSAAPIANASGQVVRWCGINTDIEEKLAAEEELLARIRMEGVLRESDVRLRAIEIIPGLIGILAPDGSVEAVNSRIMEYTGQSLEELKSWGTNGTVYPADLPHTGAVFAHSIGTGTPYAMETRLRGHDGEYRWFDNRGIPMRDSSGGIVCWYILLTDIEDRKRAEGALHAREAELQRANQYLASAQELSKTGSYTRDLGTDEQNLSDQMYQIWEFDPAKKVTHEMFLNRLHPEDRPALEAAQNAAVHAGEDFKFEFRIVTDGGEVKYLRTVTRRLKEITDRVVYLGATQDVTTSRVAEHALNSARAELAHVSRVMTLGALTASIAHEVNQPLAGIVTNANTCLRMLTPEKLDLQGARATAQRTLRDANRASEVVQRLRAMFTHKEATTEAIDLNDAAREVLALSSSELQRGRVVVRTEFDARLPAVMGDRIQLQQVIMNFVVNANDAMREVHDRPRDLSVSTVADGANVRVSVRDSGVGIDPMTASKLFEAFYSTKGHGMGIGLSVSRSIVENHGGRIWADPNDGHGATFSFAIPCRSRPAPD